MAFNILNIDKAYCLLKSNYLFYKVLTHAAVRGFLKSCGIGQGWVQSWSVWFSHTMLVQNPTNMGPTVHCIHVIMSYEVWVHLIQPNKSNTYFLIYRNVVVQFVTILAPHDSPNTDGIDPGIHFCNSSVGQLFAVICVNLSLFVWTSFCHYMCSHLFAQHLPFRFATSCIGI